MPQKMAGVKARPPQKFQVQVQATVLRHSILQLEDSSRSIHFILRFCQYLTLYTVSSMAIGA